jgi:phage terminase small subunit
VLLPKSRQAVRSRGAPGGQRATYETRTGFIRPSPWLKIANECTAIVLRIAGEFGLTPSSRTRIKIDDPAELDDFDRYMAGDPSWLQT